MGAVKQAGITTKNIALGLPARKTYTAIIETENLPVKEIEKTLKYELDKYIPMAEDAAEVDYVILGTSPQDPTKAEVLISSTAKDSTIINSLYLSVIPEFIESIASFIFLITNFISCGLASFKVDFLSSYYEIGRASCRERV